MRRVVAALGLAVLAAATIACSGEDRPLDDSAAGTSAAGGEVPAAPAASVELLGQAVAAVEAELGGPQSYTEINVQTDLVNLFVAVDGGNELAYVYRADGLEAPDEPQAQPEGAEPFSLDGVTLDAVTTFDDLLAAEVPDSALVALTLAPRPESGLVWTATLLSTRGGVFDVLLTPSGAIIGAAPR